MCGPSFNFVCLSVPEKREMIFFLYWKLERKKNEEIKGRICRRNLVLFHIKQQMIHNTCTKLQSPICNSSWKIFVTHFPMYYIAVRDGKQTNEKGRQKLFTESWFSFSQYTWPLSKCIQNMKTMAVIGAENSVTKSFIGEKKKRDK